MNTFVSKNLTVHVNSDASGNAQIHLGVALDRLPAEELVQFARWLLKRTGPQTIDIPPDLWERISHQADRFHVDPEDMAIADLCDRMTRAEKDETTTREEWEADERLRLMRSMRPVPRSLLAPDCKCGGKLIGCSVCGGPEAHEARLHDVTQKAQVKFSLGDVCTVDVSLPASEVEQLTQLRDRWADVDEIRLDLPDGSHCTWATNYPCEKPKAQPHPATCRCVLCEAGVTQKDPM